MGALPRALLVGVCAVLLAAVLADAAAAGEATSMVVGLAKCADCTRKNMKAEAAFKGLQVAIKCKNAAGAFETKAVGAVDKSGAFGVPLDAGLLRDDGELKQDCFAQLHSAANQPCPGQEPSWIVRPSGDHAGDKKKAAFVAVAGKTHYSSKECASAFLCDPFHKKHHLFHKTPVSIPHISHGTPSVPEYKPPTTPTTPVPTYKSPTPVYSHPTPTPTPIYHPPADEQKFKKLLPFIKKNPFLFPKFGKFPPGKEETKA
ncbi:hypothetical protein ACP4OV_003546 [Aristida adscensionis]